MDFSVTEQQEQQEQQEEESRILGVRMPMAIVWMVFTDPIVLKLS